MKLREFLNSDRELFDKKILRYRILVFILTIITYAVCTRYRVLYTATSNPNPLLFYVSVILLLLSVIFIFLKYINRQIQPKNILLISFFDLIIVTMMIISTGWATSPFYLLYYILLLNINIIFTRVFSLIYSMIVIVFYIFIIWYSRHNQQNFILSSEIFKLIAMLIFIFSFEWARYYKKETEEMNRRIAEKNREVTESNRLLDFQKEKLDEKNRELDEKNKHYTQMLGFVTHELKNPVQVIRNACGLFRLKKDMSPESTQKAIKRINDKAQFMEGMIEKYLALEQIEEGTLKLNLISTDIIEDIINPVIRDFKRIAEGQGIDIVFKKNMDHLRTKTDYSLLKVVYHNLVSNAVKYGAENTKIFIVLKLHKNNIRSEIINYGIGIPPDKLAEVFNKFERLSQAKETVRGTGLGLFNTKIIIEKLGGRIWCKSKVNDKTNFIFEIPLNVPEK